MIPLKTTISCAVSLDGFLDDDQPARCVLSSPADLAAVQVVRADCDAILVGGETVRRDNPSLATRDPDAAARRQARGAAPHPIKVVVTRSADLDPGNAFFTAGSAEKIVACPADRVAALTAAYGGLASVLALGVDWIADLKAALRARGVATLLVEGGGRIITAFLAAGAAERMRLALAPVLLGASGRAPFVTPGGLELLGRDRLHLAQTEQFGDTTVLWLEVKS